MDAKYTLQDLKEAFEIGREIEYRKSYYLTGESFENKCSEIINRASDGGQVDSKPANCAIFDVNNLVCPTHGTKLYKHPDGMAYCSLCNYSINWQTCC